jgi:hypothetical protein
MRNDWANMNVRTNLSLDQVKKDPRAAQTGMIPMKEAIWKPTVTKHLGKELHVGATRNLKQQGLDGRNFKLGSTERWAITFFDMAGPGAFSDIMPLPLSSGFESIDKKKEKVKAKTIEEEEEKKEKVKDQIKPDKEFEEIFDKTNDQKKKPTPVKKDDQKKKSNS